MANVPEDELGNAYEYLIKKFADDSGHTAAEFYTNRTVVHLMTQLLAPQAGESIYDPTCGTGGMLISALDEVKRSGGEYRTLKLYGQERNLITSSIARMNLFLHGVEDFEIIRGEPTWSWTTRPRVGEPSSTPSSHRLSPAAGIERRRCAADTSTRSTPTCGHRSDAAIRLQIAPAACCFTLPSAMPLTRR